MTTTANCVVTPSLAKDYLPLVDDRIAVNICADEGYHPNDLGNSFEVLVKLKEQILLPYRAIATVDLGFSLTVEDDFMVNFVLLDLADKGLVILGHKADGRAKLVLSNVGKEILVIKDKDKIAKGYLVPVYHHRLEITNNE